MFPLLLFSLFIAVILNTCSWLKLFITAPNQEFSQTKDPTAKSSTLWNVGMRSVFQLIKIMYIAKKRNIDVMASAKITNGIKGA